MLKEWFQEHISWPYPNVVQQVLFSFCCWNVLTVCPACAHGCLTVFVAQTNTEKTGGDDGAVGEESQHVVRECPQTAAERAAGLFRRAEIGVVL